MKKNVLLPLTFLLLLNLLVSGAGSCLAAGEVLIGEILPLSGGVASLGSQLKVGAEIAIDEINAEGGIKSMKGAKLKLVLGDSKSTPDGGAAETERLITREKVSVLLGSYQSGVVFPSTEVAERYKTPWVVNMGVKDEITDRGFKYVFRVCNKASFDIKEMVDAVDLFKKETGNGPKTFALLYEGTDWGRSSAGFIKKLYVAKGYKMLTDESYQPGVLDFTSQILKIKAAKPDMLIVCAYTPEHILLNKQLLEQRFSVPFGLWSVGAGSEDSAMYKALNKEAVQYMFVQDDWDVTANTKPWYKAFNDKVKSKQGGLDTTSANALGYSTIYVVKDALERAGSADRLKLRNALAATDITEKTCSRIARKMPGGGSYCPAFIQGISRVKFDQTGQNIYSHGMITQVQNGVRIPFAPVDVRTKGAKLVWPIPTN
jgi:branched-chain amino acid transport system substrate-binding protein